MKKSTRKNIQTCCFLVWLSSLAYSFYLYTCGDAGGCIATLLIGAAALVVCVLLFDIGGPFHVRIVHDDEED